MGKNQLIQLKTFLVDNRLSIVCDRHSRVYNSLNFTRKEEVFKK